ncbi:MAG: hypothetical protein ACOY90_21910 [Candidatus Zhuqueibacterota bacterium]
MKTANTSDYLEKLEALIDLDHVAATKNLQRRTFSFQEVDHIPTAFIYSIPESEWPAFRFDEIYHDQEKMLLWELKYVYMGAKLGDDRLYGIRANYGTGIIASMFGCPVYTFEFALPICKEIPRSRIDRILESGAPATRSGIVGRALDTVAYYRDMLKPFPRLSQAVGSQCLDIQGPFDNASIIWGSDIYFSLIEETDAVLRLMDIVCEATLAVIQEHRAIDGASLYEHDGAWNYLGGVCVRNDSTVNLGRSHYLDFVKRFDEKLLRPWGGWIHFCGKAHQWWPELLTIPGLKGINPYQGEFYDVLEMYEACAAAGVPIVQWTVPLDARCRERIRTGFSRIIEVADYDAACRKRDRLLQFGHAD